MTIGSLFSGIGGLELGLERAGLGPVIWQAERDPWCRKVLADHWSDAERFSDVRQIRAGRVTVPDVLCGGFPCQDISLAGTGAGLDGERSGLWSEFARIIGELRPRFVVVENVSALRRRGLDRVLGDLASSGYDATWDCVPASAIGAPHGRDRMFIVAFDPARVWDMADANVWRREAQRVADRERGHEGAPGYQLDGCNLPIWPPGPADVPAWGRLPRSAQPALCPVADGLPPAVVRPALRATGNAVAVPVAEVIGAVVLSIDGSSPHSSDCDMDDDCAPCPARLPGIEQGISPNGAPSADLAPGATGRNHEGTMRAGERVRTVDIQLGKVTLDGER